MIVGFRDLCTKDYICGYHAHGWGQTECKGIYEYEEEQDMIKANRATKQIRIELHGGRDVSYVKEIIKRLQRALDYLCESVDETKEF